MQALKLIIGGLSILLLSGCGITNQNQPHPHINKQLPPTYTQQQNTNLAKEQQIQIQLHLITKSLGKNYAKLFQVNYNEPKETIELTPIDKNVKAVIKYAKTGNATTKKAAIKNWHQFVQGVRKTSQSVSKSSGSKTAKLAILNPKKPHEQLYIAQNGKTVYDHF